MSPPEKFEIWKLFKRYFQRSGHQIEYKNKDNFLSPIPFFCLFLQSYWYIDNLKIALWIHFLEFEGTENNEVEQNCPK